MRIRIGFLAMALLAVAWHQFAFLATASGASFQGLGFFPGYDTGSIAYEVSDDGSVVVGMAPWDGAGGNNAAFRWTSQEGMIALGDLPGGSDMNWATGVSSDGSVIVGTADSALGTEVFRWAEDTGMVGIGDLPGGEFWSMDGEVSADGLVIVGSSRSGEGVQGWEAFRWTSEEGLAGLGRGPNGSSAHGVSADGSVVVGADEGACYWSQDATGHWNRHSLWTGGHASDVSADGSVIVGNAGQAYRWTNEGGPVGLGDLPGGVFRSDAHAVTADGGVVVGIATVAYPIEQSVYVRPFIWDEANGMRNFQEVLVSDYGVNLGGWILAEATDISADGQTIVGWGNNPNGKTEAWIAVIPEPATLALLLLGSLGFLGGVRSRA